MSTPLEILDLLEAGCNIEDAIHKDDWQSLRTALEAQAEELSQTQIEATDAREENYRLSDQIEELREELAQERAERIRIRRRSNVLEEIIDEKKARIARLEMTLKHTTDGAFDSIREAAFFARKALNESPAQSAAALKAEALREAAEDWEPQPCPLTRPAIRERLREMADELEREAKEASGAWNGN